MQTIKQLNNKVMEIKEAIQIIANTKSIIASGAEQALTNDDDLNMFVKQISEQAGEEGTNKERLISMFGKDVIETIINYSKKTINLHILLPFDVLQKKPSTTKIVFDYGQLQVVFGQDINDTSIGLHCIIEDTKENLLNWLNQFEEVIIGCGTPMFESFTKMNINETLN